LQHSSGSNPQQWTGYLRFDLRYLPEAMKHVLLEPSQLTIHQNLTEYKGTTSCLDYDIAALFGAGHSQHFRVGCELHRISCTVGVVQDCVAASTAGIFSVQTNES